MIKTFDSPYRVSKISISLSQSAHCHILLIVIFCSLSHSARCHILLIVIFCSLSYSAHCHILLIVIFCSLSYSAHCHILLIVIFCSLSCTAHCHVQLIDTLFFTSGHDVYVFRSREQELIQYDAVNNVTTIIMDNATFVS